MFCSCRGLWRDLFLINGISLSDILSRYDLRHRLSVDVTCVHKHKLPLWRGAGAGGVLAGTRRQLAAGDGVPPSLQILYCLTHTYCSHARLPPSHPFVGAPILQRHFQVQWRARLPPPRVLLPHTCTQDGWFLQPKRRPARLPRRTVPSNSICRCSRMRARLPLHKLLLHTQVSR